MAKGGYYFYLKKCLLPIAPEELELKINNQNETITLINEGEVNILKSAGLTDIEFECDIPQVQYPFATYSNGFKDASYFLEYFEELKTSKAAFQFIVSRALPNGKVLFSTNIKVSMEEYTLTESADNGFDVKVKIKLKQYRDYSTKTVSVTISTSKTSTSSTTTATAKSTSTRSSSTTSKKSNTSKTKTYTVVKGDCLWTIAKKYYGTATMALCKKIYNANKSVIDKHKGGWTMIWPGDKLTIPANS